MPRATLIAAIVLALVAIAQLIRVILDIDVVIGRTAVPLWVSYFAIPIAGGLSVALFRQLRRSGPGAP